MTFSASDNEEIPEFPILFPLILKIKQYYSIIIHHQITPRNNSVRDELTTSADDKEVTPESLISLSIKKKEKTKKVLSISMLM